jgi:protein phosphatase inhibitor 2
MDESSLEDNRKLEAGDGATLPAAHENSVKVKPALKTESHKKNSAARASGDKHLKWDEQAIEEHDQLRGTRMKIDEPNTPYTHYDSGAESDDSRRPKSPANQKQTLSWDTLQTRLDSVAAVREQYPPGSPASSHAETDHSDVEDERKKEMRKLEFKDHRKRHYNEMELVKKFRQEHPEDTMDADADNGGGFADNDGDADDEA